MNRSGTTLIETMMSMCLMALAALAGLEAFSAGRRVFFKMDAAEEREARAAAGLDRARRDARDAGRGMAAAIRLGLQEGIVVQADGFTAAWAEKETAPAAALSLGDDFVPLADAAGFETGRTVCLLAADGGETRTVSAVLDGGIRLAAPLARDYPAEGTSLLLVGTVEIFLDEAGHVVRRRVDGGSAQPLVEEAAGFACRLDAGARALSLELRLAGCGEAAFTATVLGKNLWLGGAGD